VTGGAPAGWRKDAVDPAIVTDRFSPSRGSNVAATNDIFEDDSLEPRRPVRKNRRDDLPVFVTVMMIFDLLACALKFFGVIAGVLVLAGVYKPPQQAQLPLWQTLAGFALGLLILASALPAAIAILRKRGWGLSVGWIAAALSALGIIVGGWISFQSVDAQLAAMPRQPGLDPEAFKMIMLATMAATIGFQILYFILYCVALAVFGRWLARRQPGEE